MSESERPRYINADRDGIQASWKTFWAIVAISLGGLIPFVWQVFGQANAFKSDVMAHNVDMLAHEVVLEDGAAAVPIAHAVQNNHKEIVGFKDVRIELGNVRDSMNDDRSDRLADRASDRETNPRRSREVWKHVKRRAMSNLKSKKPIREGLDPYLE